MATKDVSMKKIISFCFLVITFANHASAQRILVEATKIDEEKIEPSRSFTVISSDEIKLQKSHTVTDVLRKIPGLVVVQQGSAGQPTSVFIRGARSEDTLVFIDGVEVNDAMSPGNGFDFSNLSSENIERIEVYRGPQSVRFGGGALGGVINIITKTAHEKPKLYYLTEAGTNQTYRQAFSTYGKINHFNYLLGVDRLSTDGFSASSQKYEATEADGAEIQSVSGKFGWQLSNTTKLQTTFKYTEAEVDLDAFGGPGGDDPNSKNYSKRFIAGLSGSDRFFDDRLKSTIGFYFSEMNRKGENAPDSFHLDTTADHFLSENRKVQSENELILGEFSTIRLGLQWRDESGFAENFSQGTLTSLERESQSLYGGSLTYLFESQTWFFDLGGRFDQSSADHSISSFRSSLGRKFSGDGYDDGARIDNSTKVYISYGTGYKLPSLYQLHSIYGNQNLKFEDSSTIEATLEQQLTKAFLLTVTGFENRYQNYIDLEYDVTTSSGRYYNISKVKSRGFEVQAALTLLRTLKISSSYTYLETKDESTGLKLLRRPQNGWTASATYGLDSCEFFGQYTYRGKRDDYDPVLFTRVTIPAYDLFHFGGSYKFKKYFKIFARAENAFDTDYEEVAGYGTAGRSVYGGLSGEFQF